MTEQQRGALEVTFFIISFILVLQNPIKLLAVGAEYVHIISPTIVAILLISSVMVYASVLRILNDSKLFLNLFAGIVYFVNITKWINVI